jgi:hypothetical protein
MAMRRTPRANGADAGGVLAGPPPPGEWRCLQGRFAFA